MAQNVVIAGATFNDVPSVDIPISGGGTARFVDSSDADAAAGDISQGKTAYVNGVKLTGTNTGGGGVSPIVGFNVDASKTKTLAVVNTNPAVFSTDKADIINYIISPNQASSGSICSAIRLNGTGAYTCLDTKSPAIKLVPAVGQLTVASSTGLITIQPDPAGKTYLSGRYNVIVWI